MRRVMVAAAIAVGGVDVAFGEGAAIPLVIFLLAGALMWPEP